MTGVGDRDVSGLPGDDRDLSSTVSRLERERPLPDPNFRGNLRRQLASDSPRPSPRRERLLVAGYAASGTVLLLVVVAGVAGLGPLAAA